MLFSAQAIAHGHACVFEHMSKDVPTDRSPFIRGVENARIRWRDFARRSLLLWRADSQSAPTELLPLTRPSTSAWLSDERGNVGRTRQGGSCARARARTCARGRAGRSRRPPCGGATCHGGDPNLCSTSAAACCADACNGHFRRTDACRPAGPGPPTGTPGASTCSINLCSTRATPDPPRWPAWPSAPTL